MTVRDLEAVRIAVRSIAVFVALVSPFLYLMALTREGRESVLLTVGILAAAYLTYESALAMLRAERKRARIVAEEIDGPRATDTRP